MTKLYGVYSAKAAEKIGTKIWQRPDGTEVEVVSVADDPKCLSFLWDDKVFVGEVTKFVRPGRTREMSSEVISGKFMKRYYPKA